MILFTFMVSDVTDFYQDCPAISTSGKSFLVSKKWAYIISFLHVNTDFYLFQEYLIHTLRRSKSASWQYIWSNNGTWIRNAVFLLSIQWIYLGRQWYTNRLNSDNDGLHCADDMLICILFVKQLYIDSNLIAVCYLSEISGMPALVQVKAWWRTCAPFTNMDWL